jgi:antitoxin CptB
MIKDKEIKKKKLLYRLKYRGIKELDILFERFASKYFDNINDNDLEELNFLLEVNDQDLLDFILNKKEIPSNLKNKTFYRLQSFK